VKTLFSLFLAQLQDLYDAEHQLVRALPRLAQAASDRDLRETLLLHLKETHGHINRLEAVFKAVGHKPRPKRCRAIAGMVEEIDEIITEHRSTPAANAALIAAGQKIEHYEIAAYGCLVEWAKTLGFSAASMVLDRVLSQEKAADRKLNELAVSRCNEFATELAGVTLLPAGRLRGANRTPPRAVQR